MDSLFCLTTYTLFQIAIAVGSQFYHTFVVFTSQIAIAVGSLFGITTTLFV